MAQSQLRPSVVTAAPTIPTTASTTRRNMGGRRPVKTAGMSPEEEERRRVRRERNKMAAARCRKRRVDHTNSLLIETEGLEQKKQGLQREIQQLQMEKEELEFLLEAHKPCCRIKGNGEPPSPPDIKPFAFPPGLEKLIVPVKRESGNLAAAAATAAAPLSAPPPAKKLMLGSDATSGAKPPRPNSLPVAAAFIPSQNTLKAAVSVAEVAGIPIPTPTSGIPFNFDSLMDGGTGLTPVSGPLVPSCSSQQRSSGCVDLSSPDSVPPKLVSL